MKKLLGITLGIMTALGGFVDLGQIVFTMQAGALFGYSLLWTIIPGTIAIILYMEMCGRVAVVAKEPVFATVRTRLGSKLGLFTLIASNLLNLITCAAELGGVAIIFRLITGWPERAIVIGVTLVFALLVYLSRFQWIERTFGLGGVVMVVFAVAAVALHPDWNEVARNLMPRVQAMKEQSPTLYWYFAVGIFSAMLMEYEVHFYSSGAMEEDWKVEDLGENFMVAALGSLLGSFLTAALLIVAVLVFLPKQIFPEQLSTALMTAAIPFGPKALMLALAGGVACLGGAAIETALSGAYNICQFFNRPWGKNMRPREAPLFTAMWLGMFALALLLLLTGVRPLKLVDISIIFSMVVMPLTYYPILSAASDRNIMREHVNSKLVSILAMLFLVLICLAAAAAIPLAIVTNYGSP